MREKHHWVMDYETMRNLFVAVFESHKTTERKIFIVHKLRNDFPEFIQFLKENKTLNEYHVSFNGLAFDSQITEFIIKKHKLLLTLGVEEIVTEIYNKAQEVISRSNRGEFSEWSEKDLTIKQIDVFKLNHWDNPAKRSSLKWIQYSMDWFNIQEMPIHHDTLVETKEDVSMVVNYCINDVKSTKQIMNLSKEQINLRATLTKLYNINLYSASEPRISKELFLMFLSEQLDMNKYDLRQLRTNRGMMNVKDLILPYTEFKTPVFQDLLDNFKHVVIDPNNTKGGFKYSIKYKGVKTDFGLGGVHGAKPGIFVAKPGMIIMTSDVTSYYPNLAIRNGWSPAHLPKNDFCKLYEWFFDERTKIPKSDPINYVYKIILNSTYGLSNDKNSFLYDPYFTMQITINGQLSLMMLYEMLAESIPDCEPLMQNTDGIEMIIPEQYKDTYLQICENWQTLTQLKLEHDEYSKIIIGDCNNYIAVNKKGKYKCKGRFEFENLALHKNKSFLIIPKAIFNYLIHDIKPEQYLMENRNIFDYCAGVKIKGDWQFEAISIVKKVPDSFKQFDDVQKQEYIKKNGWVEYYGSWVKKEWIDSGKPYDRMATELNWAFKSCLQKELVIDRTPLQKTIRYYISEKGMKIIKVNKADRREIQVEAGKWMQTDFSKSENKKWEDYGINEAYYLEKIYAEINNIIPPQSKQLTLF